MSFACATDAKGLIVKMNNIKKPSLKKIKRHA